MRNYRLIRINSLNLTVRAYNTAKKNNIKTVGKFIDLIEDVERNGRTISAHKFSPKHINRDLVNSLGVYLSKK
jgi:DNA-directed RNA polymerase alpha subunit